MRTRFAVGAFAVAALTLSVAVADEALKSGPQVGKNIPGPFNILNVNGAAAGKSICLV